MNAMKSEMFMLAAAATVEVVEEMRDPLPAEDLPAPESTADAGADPAGDRFASLIQDIAATPIEELERLIGQLQEARAYLQAEGERVERETVGYVQLSQTALELVKIISETVGEWRKAGHPVRGGTAP